MLIDIERIKRMVIDAIYQNDARCKQWYLLEIANELSIPAKEWDEVEKGVSP